MSEQLMVNETTLRVAREDITTFDIEAFVYYATPDLVLGTGFGNAIAVRGGPTIQSELNELAPAQVCDAVASTAGKLSATTIIHAVGPRFQEQDLEDKLRRTIVNTLRKADELSIARIAFPPMGRGFYGVPLTKSAELTVGAIRDYLTGETGIREVVICVNDHAEVAAFEALL